MTIKEARKSKGLTQSDVSTITGVPRKTLCNWEAFESGAGSSEARKPSDWAKNFVIDKILNSDAPKFEIRNSTVKKYAEICKQFSKDTAEWNDLEKNKFYTASRSAWSESDGNAAREVSVSWAFHLSDDEIEQRAAEKLFERLMAELNSSDKNKEIFNKFNF